MKIIADFHYLRGSEDDVVKNYMYEVGKIWSASAFINFQQD